MWNLTGTPTQNALVQQAIDRCDFDFAKCLPSLVREGKSSVRVEWADLSRYAASEGKAHEHVHDGDLAHPIERVVEGRSRVLGLFYLPPHTRIVLDLSLERDPIVAQEVFLAEGAHCVDYHYMTAEHRRRFVNSVHVQQLPPAADTSDGVAFNLDGHTCSWFDVGTYADWVGESWMCGMVEGTSDIPCTILLNHPLGPEDRAIVRQILGIKDTSKPTPTPSLRVFANRNSSVVHDAHAGIEPVRWWGSLISAVGDGMRACKTCKP